MKKFLLSVMFALIPVLASAQAAPTDKFAWNIDAPSLATAQGYRYDLELDNVLQTAPLVATCENPATPFLCKAPIPAVTPTTHTARVRAVDTSGATPIPGPW